MPPKNKKSNASTKPSSNGGGNLKQNSKTDEDVRKETSEPFNMEKFKLCMVDFCNDLSITFPEYSELWKKWQDPELSESEWGTLLDFCKDKYPCRFFDFLYKNEEIFGPVAGGMGVNGNEDVIVEDVDSDEDEDDIKSPFSNKKKDEDREDVVDSEFLPGVDFGKLYHCQGVSANTKDSIWKYLQTILFLVMKTIRSSSEFGGVEELFEGVDANELQDQMKKTLEGLTDFFQKNDEETKSSGGGGDDAGAGASSSSGNEKAGTGFSAEDMPNMDELNDHLKGLLGGKIGRFATEIMEEYNKELEDLMGDVKNVKNVKDVVGNMFKNGNKMKDLLKKIQDKFQHKMDTGEISKDDVMKETKDLFSKLKGMKNGKEMNQYMKSMMSTMGGLGNMGLGKNTRMDLGAMERMIKKQEMTERLRAKVESNRLQKEEDAKRESYRLKQTAPNVFSFKANGDAGEESVPKSKIERKADAEKATKEIDDLVNFIESTPSSDNKKKKKGADGIGK
jgi:hypothetical protein